MTPKVVVGKRVAPTGMPPGLTLFIVAIVLLALAVRSFVSRDMTWGGLYTFVALVVALAGRSLRGDAKLTSEIVSACPVCAAERQRRFFGLAGQGDWGASCGVCTAYLRLDSTSLQVREESLDANLQGVITSYWLKPEQYASAVTADRLAFKLPPMCAVCGDANALELRGLTKVGLTADAGVIGDVASSVARETALDTGIRKASRNYNSNLPRSGADLDEQLMELKVPVCAQHMRDVDSPCEYSEGSLVFASYRYYKAFCELNNITAGEKAAVGEAPVARVVAS